MTVNSTTNNNDNHHQPATVDVQVRLLPALTSHPLFPTITQPHWAYWMPALQQWAEEGVRRLLLDDQQLVVDRTTQTRVWLPCNQPLEQFPCCVDTGSRRWFGLDVSPEYVQVVPVLDQGVEGAKMQAVDGNAAGIWVDTQHDVTIRVRVVFVGTDNETLMTEQEMWASNTVTRQATPVHDDSERDNQQRTQIAARRLASIISHQGGDNSTVAAEDDVATNARLAPTPPVVDRSSAMGLQGYVARQRRMAARQNRQRRRMTGLTDDVAENIQEVREFDDEDPEDDAVSHATAQQSLSTVSIFDDAVSANVIRTDHLMTVLTCIFQLTDRMYPNSANSVFIALRRFVIPYLLQRSLRSIHLLMLGLAVDASEYEALDMRTLEMTLQKLLITPTNGHKQFNNIRGLFITNEDGMPWIGCQRAVKRLMMTWAAAAPWLFYLHEVTPAEMAAMPRRNTRAATAQQPAASGSTTNPIPVIVEPSAPPEHETRRAYYRPAQRRGSVHHSSNDPKAASNFPERLSLNDRYQRIALIPVTLTSFNSYQHLIANSQLDVFFFISSPSMQSRSVRLPHIQSMPFHAPPTDYFLCYMMNQLFNDQFMVAYPRQKQEPILRFLEDVRPCLVNRNAREACSVCRQERSQWKSSFFGMSLMDCEKVFLHLYLRMIEHYNEIRESIDDMDDLQSEYSNATHRAHFDHSFFWQQLHRVMHSKALVASLSPQAVNAFHFMHGDKKVSKEVQSLVDEIHESCWQQNQWVQFVQVIEPSAEYVKANGRLQIKAKDLKPFLKTIQEKFLFNSHFHLSSPDQLLPHHPNHSAPYPHLMTNPFAVNRKKSLLLINSVESVVGFHKSIHVSFGAGTTKSSGSSRGRGIDHSWSRNLGADTGGSGDVCFSVGTSNTNSQSAVAGSREGGSGNMGLGITGLSLGAGANKGWSTERAVGVTNQKERSVDFGQNVFLSVKAGMGYDDSCKQSQSASRSKGSSKDESVAVQIAIEHPEAFTKIIVGLKQHIRNVASNPKMKRKNRLVLIFYQQPESYTELAVKRLGWTESGHPPEQVVEGCEHHRSSVKQYMKCCRRWYSCHTCHIEQAESEACRHATPADVSAIKCSACSTVQSIKSSEDHSHCVHGSCEQPLSAYNCSECRLWTHKPVKHCDSCNRCVARDFFEYHQRICQSQVACGKIVD